MGLINSRLLLQDSQRNDDANNDTTPVMGNGYCPIYDAALVGDWETLISLCEGGVIADGDKNDGDEDGKDDEDDTKKAGDALESTDGQSISSSSKKMMDRIASLEVFDGGHDYSYDVDDVSCTEAECQEGQARKSQQKQQPQVGTEEKKHGSSENTTCETSGEEASHAHDHETNGKIMNDPQLKNLEQQTQKQTYTLFIDAKGNTPLHLACRRDPPLSAIRALLSLHPSSVWSKTHDGWIPLHLACHCGCDVEVANELLDVMEKTSCDNAEKDNSQDENEGNSVEDEDEDPLLPRDIRGRTPLHLACASSRDPRRRPDLVRLLLLRSKDPRKAALAEDCVDLDRRLGVDLALGELSVIVGGLNVGDEETDEHVASNLDREASNGSAGNVSNGNGSASDPKLEQSTKRKGLGRTPLNLVEDDYREELEEAIQPDFPIKKAMAACRGEEIDDEENSEDGESADNASAAMPDNLDSFYECWATLSILMLAAGTSGSAERVKEALSGGEVVSHCGSSVISGNSNTDSPSDPNLLISSFSKPCHEVIQDFQAIHKACQTVDEVYCPSRFRELAKKFLAKAGQVDKRTIGRFSDLKRKWETGSMSST